MNDQRKYPADHLSVDIKSHPSARTHTTGNTLETERSRALTLTHLENDVPAEGTLEGLVYRFGLFAEVDRVL